MKNKFLVVAFAVISAIFYSCNNKDYDTLVIKADSILANIETIKKGAADINQNEYVILFDTLKKYDGMFKKYVVDRPEADMNLKIVTYGGIEKTLKRQLLRLQQVVAQIDTSFNKVTQLKGDLKEHLFPVEEGKKHLNLEDQVSKALNEEVSAIKSTLEKNKNLYTEIKEPVEAYALKLKEKNSKKK